MLFTAHINVTDLAVNIYILSLFKLGQNYLHDVNNNVHCEHIIVAHRTNLGEGNNKSLKTKMFNLELQNIYIITIYK